MGFTAPALQVRPPSRQLFFSYLGFDSPGGGELLLAQLDFGCESMRFLDLVSLSDNGLAKVAS